LECGKDLTHELNSDTSISWRAKRCSYKKTGVVYCSPKCSYSSRGRTSSVRMIANNPMMLEEARKKMSDTLKRIGHRPSVLGGNGRGMTVPQEILLNKLGDGWYPELVVVTGNGYLPYHYKIDIANPIIKVAIEVDGGSHFSLVAQKRDRRKEEFLKSKGWTVYRFKNSEIMETINKVLGSITSK
jgi:hypothetical protein